MAGKSSKIARASHGAGTARLVALAGILAAGGLPAAESKAGTGGLPTSPSQTFRVYCASCHGSEGRGDGPIAATLITKPADLTRIAERNDGVFPKDRVAATIDGRELVAAHGPREMPVWGDALVWPEEDTPERRAEVKRKIDDLVALLESMQKKPAAPKP